MKRFLSIIILCIFTGSAAQAQLTPMPGPTPSPPGSGGHPPVLACSSLFAYIAMHERTIAELKVSINAILASYVEAVKAVDYLSAELAKALASPLPNPAEIAILIQLLLMAEDKARSLLFQSQEQTRHLIAINEQLKRYRDLADLLGCTNLYPVQ